MEMYHGLSDELNARIRDLEREQVILRERIAALHAGAIVRCLAPGCDNLLYAERLLWDHSTCGNECAKTLRAQRRELLAELATQRRQLMAAVAWTRPQGRAGVETPGVVEFEQAEIRRLAAERTIARGIQR